MNVILPMREITTRPNKMKKGVSMYAHSVEKLSLSLLRSIPIKNVKPRNPPPTSVMIAAIDMLRRKYSAVF